MFSKQSDFWDVAVYIRRMFVFATYLWNAGSHGLHRQYVCLQNTGIFELEKVVFYFRNRYVFETWRFSNVANHVLDLEYVRIQRLRFSPRTQSRFTHEFCMFPKHLDVWTVECHVLQKKHMYIYIYIYIYMYIYTYIYIYLFLKHSDHWSAQRQVLLTKYVLAKH